MDTTFSKEEVFAAYEAAPIPVRKTFAGEETVAIVLEIQRDYGLHVDTTGMIGKELGYLLLGLTTPSEFHDRLHANGLPAETVNRVINDVNEKIFQPLQKRMHEERPSEPIKEASYAQVTSQARVQFSAPTPASIPEQPIATLKNIPETEVPRSTPRPAEPASFQVRTMASDMAVLKGDSPAAVSPWHTTPARSFQTSSIPSTQTPTPAVSESVRGSWVPPVQKTSPQAPTPSVNEFSKSSTLSPTDPYRESPL
jgi:hypothetical protein